MRRPFTFVALAALGAVVVAGAPSAAPPPTTPKGDITAVLAGSGIKVASTPNPPGDGSTGDVTVSLANCASGQVLKSGSPGTWSCAADATSAGSNLADSSSVSAEESTSSTTCSDLATPGPSVTVDAPEGLVSIFAEAELQGFVDGSGSSESRGGAFVCVQIGANTPARILHLNNCVGQPGGLGCQFQPAGFSTRQTSPADFQSGHDASLPGIVGGWLVAPVSGTGPHTVTLKYGCLQTVSSTGTLLPCDSTHAATFRNRKLWVMGLG
jgi:hypothetical protein